MSPWPSCVHPRGRRGGQTPSVRPVEPCPVLLPAPLPTLEACCLCILGSSAEAESCPRCQRGADSPPSIAACLSGCSRHVNAGLHQEPVFCVASPSLPAGGKAAGSRLAAGCRPEQSSQDWCFLSLRAACCSRSRVEEAVAEQCGRWPGPPPCGAHGDRGRAPSALGWAPATLPASGLASPLRPSPRLAPIPGVGRPG